MHGTDRNPVARLDWLPRTDPVDDFDPDAESESDRLDRVRNAVALRWNVAISERVVRAIRADAFALDRAAVLRDVSRLAVLRDLGLERLAASGYYRGGAPRSAVCRPDARGVAARRRARGATASPAVML